MPSEWAIIYADWYKCQISQIYNVTYQVLFQSNFIDIICFPFKATVDRKKITNMMKKLTLGLSALICIPCIATADGFDFSLSGGFPFLITPTVSTTHDGIEYYANLKIGLDGGLSLGAEKQYGNHVYGVFIGAVGARKTEFSCFDNDECDFILFEFEEKTTQGIGLSYEYRFNSTRDGWAFRLEGGYGEESRHNEKRFDGNVQIVYHF